MSTPEVGLGSRLLIVPRGLTGAFVWLSISIMLFTHTFARLVAYTVVQVSTVVGDNGGLAKSNRGANIIIHYNSTYACGDPHIPTTQSRSSNFIGSNVMVE